MIMYPRPGWSLSLYDLVDIVYATVTTIVLTIPIVAPPEPNAWYLPLMVFIAPSIAPCVVMQPLPMAVMSIVFLFAFSLAFSLGFLVYSLGMVASDGTMNRAWACFAMLPFTVLLSLGLPQARTKFSGFVAAGLTMGFCYIPVGFYIQDPYTEVGTLLLLLVCMLSICTGLAIMWKLLRWIPYKGPEPLQVFAYAYADLFDILVGYFDSGYEHPEVIKSAYDQFDEACMAVAPCKKVSPALSAAIWNLAGELFALYDCLNQHQFDSVTQKMLWEPLASEVFDIRGAVGKTLRKTADGEPTEADMDMLRKVRALQKHAGEVSVTLRDCQALAGEELNRAQVTRFYYAIESILSIATLAERYRILHEEADKAAKEKVERNKSLSLCTKVAGVFRTISSAIVGWLKRPLFDDLHGFSDLMSRMRVPLRTAFSMNILCTLLVLWGNYSEIVRLHGFWAVIPQYVLFLPTAGATLLKGTRRIIGTLLAGAVAVLCLYLHPDNMAAFYVENILFTIVAKLGMKNKTVGYAAYVFSFTWAIIGWASIMFPMPESQQLELGLWRFIFTTGGVLLVLLTSCLIFPNFAATQLIKASETSIESVAEGVAPILIDGCFQEYEGDDERLAALMNKWEDFGREAYSQIALRINLMDDAAAEIAIYGRLHLVPELSKRVWRKQRDITSIQRSGLVLFTSVLVLYPHTNDPQIRDLFRPANDRIRALGKAVQASANRMIALLKTGVNSPSISEADDDLHVEVQRCIEAMRDLQDRITDEFVTNPNRHGDASANMKLFHAAYALSYFATCWEKLENVLMGERVPCEMAESSPNNVTSSPSQAVPTLRGRVQSASITARFHYLSSCCVGHKTGYGVLNIRRST